MSFTAKSVILDIANSYGGTTFLGIRSVDFWFESSKITIAEADITCYATSSFDANYPPSHTFETALIKTSTITGTQWVSGNGQLTNQRLICVFDTSQEFDEIRINNHHNTGADGTRGAQNVKITISTDAISDTTYNAAVANSSVIYNSTFDAHTASNVEDEQILTLIVPEITGDVEADIPAPTCEIGSGAILETDIPALISTISSGAFLETSIPALTMQILANEISHQGNLADSFGALTMTGDTDVYDSVIGSFGAFTATMAGEANFIQFDADLPFLEIAISAASGLDITFPDLLAEITGRNSIKASLQASFPFFSFSGYVGAQSEMEIPSLEMTGQATTAAMLSLVLSFPVLGAEIVADFREPISMIAALPGLTQASSAFHNPVSNISCSFPVLTTQISGITGIIASINSVIPFFRDVRISVTSSPTNIISAQLPPMTCNASLVYTDPDTILRYIRGQLR